MGIKALTSFLFLVLSSCSRAQTVDIVAPTPTPTPMPAVAMVNLPPPPVLPVKALSFLLTTGGHSLILEYETGGRSGYDPHPEWPGGASGVTIGVGYDCGYYAKSIIDSDWHEIEQQPRSRLLQVAGLTGSRARQAKTTVRDIYVQWQIAVSVFDNVDVAREFANAKRGMPGFVDLRPNAQAALISLGFNRGWSFIGPNRTEMRDIRDVGVPKQDYNRIATQLRKMIRVWRGTDIERGMTRRRIAESELVLSP